MSISKRSRQGLAAGGASVHGPITQRAFLLAMGMAERARVLGVNRVEGCERLAGEAQMGNLFKVLAATSPGLAIPYPFVQA